MLSLACASASHVDSRDILLHTIAIFSGSRLAMAMLKGVIGFATFAGFALTSRWREEFSSTHSAFDVPAEVVRNRALPLEGETIAFAPTTGDAGRGAEAAFRHARRRRLLCRFNLM